MADWDGLRRDLEDGVTPPPLAALRERRRHRQQRKTIATACAVAMVGTASGVALLGRAEERDRARTPIAAPPTELSKVVHGGQAPPPRDYEQHVVTDIDFVSATTGWALGIRCVGDTCDVASWRTDDGGRTWSPPAEVATKVPRTSFHEEDPSGGAVRSLRMVDDRLGYAFNPDLYVTTDGGLTWSRDPRPSKVTSVSVAGGSVWVSERGCVRDVDCDVVVRTGPGAGAPLDRLSVPRTRGAAALLRRAGDRDAFLLTWDGPEEPRAALHATATGGETWTQRRHPCPEATAALLSAGPGRPLWVVCTTPAGRRAFLSDDAGRSWRPTGDPPDDGEVTDLVALSATHAYLTLQNPGRLLVTRDGGATWRPAEGTGRAYGYANLDVADPTHAWAMGDAGQLWRTTDGTRWERLALPPAAPRATPRPAAQAPADANVRFTGLHFTDPRTGWALGRDCAARRCRLALRRTTDGGATWQVANAPAEPFPDGPQDETGVTSVVFADDLNGYLYGPGLYVTRDGGASWKFWPGRIADLAVRDGFAWAVHLDTCARPERCGPYVGRAPVGSGDFAYGFTGTDSPLRDLADLAVAGADTAYLLGALPGTTGAAALLATDDGGRTWQRRPAPCPDAVGRQVAAAGDLWVVCAGEDGRPGYSDFRTAHSTDGGRTWTERAVGRGPGRPAGFVALSPEVGWRNDDGKAAGVRVTTDGGRTWRPAGPPGDTAAHGWLLLSVVDATHAFAGLADERYFRTADGGATWQPIARP